MKGGACEMKDSKQSFGGACSMKGGWGISQIWGRKQRGMGKIRGRIHLSQIRMILWRRRGGIGVRYLRALFL